jgi:putative intracellular protease/amidase
VSKQTGWPIGFWWSELAHPYWEFTERGYKVDIYRPDGGKLQADSWSDPRDESKYSATDLISLGFICSPDHAQLVENSKPIGQLKIGDYDAVLFVGGQASMYTFRLWAIGCFVRRTVAPTTLPPNARPQRSKHKQWSEVSL